MDSTPLARRIRRALPQSFRRRQVECEKRSGLRVDRVQLDRPAETDRWRGSSLHARSQGWPRRSAVLGSAGASASALLTVSSRGVPVKIEIGFDRRPGEQAVRQVRLNRQALAPRRHAQLAKMRVEAFLSTLGGKRGKPRRFVCATPAHARANCRIQRDRAVKSSPGFARAFFRVAIFIKAALQIILRAPRRFSSRLFPPCALRPESLP